MEPMTTMFEIINRLQNEGYTTDFNLQQDILDKRGYDNLHVDFIIDKFYRFEGESDPADEATIYAISSIKHGIKGILVNGAGIYTNEHTDKMLKALDIKEQ